VVFRDLAVWKIATRQPSANMEGMLLVPPEKGTIIGRAVWKVRVYAHINLTIHNLTASQCRYVVIGSPHREDLRSPATLSQAMTTSRIQASRGGAASKGPPKSAETVYFSIYKTKVCLAAQLQPHSRSMGIS
jgi:hypothetical protein